VYTVTDRVSNPFGFRPDCAQFVPGYGDVNAAFHVIGDHPGIHGGTDTQVPFSNAPGRRLLGVLAAGGLLETADVPPTADETYLSYLHLCVPDGTTPSHRSYLACEPFIDAEVRAIAAHVLLPVGRRATDYVLRTHSAQARRLRAGMSRLHATEIAGNGFLIMPVAEPADWSGADARALTDALVQLQATDYRREADLGRFLAEGGSYFVR
jgi:uracil-DNA glycosylase family 4